MAITVTLHCKDCSLPRVGAEAKIRHGLGCNRFLWAWSKRRVPRFGATAEDGVQESNFCVLIMLIQGRLLSAAILPFCVFSALANGSTTQDQNSPTFEVRARQHAELFLVPASREGEQPKLCLNSQLPLARLRLMASPRGLGQDSAVHVLDTVLDRQGSLRMEIPAGVSLGDLDLWAIVHSDELLFGPMVTAMFSPSVPAFGDISLLPRPGTVIVSEVMKDPSAVSDTNGEWIEFFNTTNAPVDIEGWVLSDLGSDATVLENGGAGIVIPARGYGVIAREIDPSLNGGLSALASYSGVSLTNSDDEVRISLPNGLLVDEIRYDDGVLWPDPNGASLQLSNLRLGTVWNDLGSNWCTATQPYGAGDLGTPGAKNEDC